MPLDPTDERHLRRAIALAAVARERGDHPFGALLVDSGGTVLHEAENTVVTQGDITCHAELSLVQLAVTAAPARDLRGCTLYTSTEPCAMCAGAIFWAGIGRVVYALGHEALAEVAAGPADEWLLALSAREVFARGSHSVEVSGPHLVEEACAVHLGYWR